MSIASPKPPVEPLYYSKTSPRLPIPNSKLEKIYFWKMVDFIFPSEAR
jgi:hypothetical protein